MFFHHAVTVIRPGRTVDRYRNEVPDWAGATRTEVREVVVIPSEQTEVQDIGRVVTTTGWMLVSKPGTDPDIRSQDRIEWQDKLLEVVGEVGRFPVPLTGAVHHVQAHLEVVSG
jgi:hypothetical protein